MHCGDGSYFAARIDCAASVSTCNVARVLFMSRHARLSVAAASRSPAELVSCMQKQCYLLVSRSISAANSNRALALYFLMLLCCPYGDWEHPCCMSLPWLITIPVLCLFVCYSKLLCGPTTIIEGKEM